ncbi:MAG: MgtC/SapB family protein [Pseudohongiella nitratireducens]|nr:MgtC/SapB family protein [Pseudohongiella nitratireducens]
MEIVDPNWQAQLEMFVHVLIAVVLGGLVGMEREAVRRPAGVRTYAILSGAACLLVVLTDVIITFFSSESVLSVMRTDPVRVVEAIITGTAFLGAGTIFRHGDKNVEGLTTAASMLLVASVGIAVALDQIYLAIMVTTLTLILLRVARTLLTRH